MKQHKVQLTKNRIDSMLNYATLPINANVDDLKYFFKRWIGWNAIIVVERNEIIDDTTELKELFNEFCHAYNRSFEEQYNALQQEFNPIENYDRYEETETTTKDIYGKQKTTSDTLNYGSAFNSGSNYGNRGKNTITTDSDAFTDTNTSNTDEHIDNGNVKVVSHIHGNIGVTESTTMLKKFKD